MKIEWIVEFLTLVEEGSFTTASRRLHISQSSLSKHLAAMERELGYQLLDRSTHTCIPTRVGDAAYDCFKTVARDYDDSLEHLKNVALGYDGELRIGLMLYSLPLYGEKVLSCAQAALPTMHINIRAMEAADLRRGLAQGALDICLVLNAEIPSDENVSFRPVSNDKLVAMVSYGDPLEHKSSISAKELSQRIMVFPSSSTEYNSYIESLFANAGCPLDNIVLSSQENTQLHTMQLTGGVAVVTEQFRWSNLQGVRYIDLEEGWDIELGWAYRSDIAKPCLPLLMQRFDDVLQGATGAT